MFLEEIILFLKVGGVGDSGKNSGLQVRDMGFNSNSSTRLTLVSVLLTITQVEDIVH